MTFIYHPHPCPGTRCGRDYHILRTVLFLFLPMVFWVGCTTTRQQTFVAGETENLKRWDGYEVRWVETVTGERIDFVEGSGRIDVVRNRESRLVEYTVIGTDSLGVEHQLDAGNLALVNTVSTREDPFAYTGFLLLSATIVGGVLFFSSSPLF